ncbi:TPA: CHASE2 domain-containing protein [Pseudomonas aeruginosa]|uniref:CHASE2 domain-containing protein n=1 Tax=Pseudomonas aeruginosa TaxID=287 RepID=UPI00053EC872|nr:CHASE2 domain-containing protein [Pseudomonas aeruginosa]MCO3323870.1 CHASE2 domain-containing protein [Pseudomonas aeruginosa]RTT02297.1 CHASE2 domain-containing protein [Pseudomonas aeruginosa]WBI85626.1 Adaptive-response sensory-kinase SasA [Pseudomonas aeruginosa]HCE7955202.1 CHASE2 domain-containing protein [Pseudomonas aeruginosa]HCF2829513.1 CHASE2 domain-containing protein [Pseudomonas aeruginosa]
MKALDRQDEPSQAQRLFRGLVREWLLVSLLLLPLTAVLSLSSGLPLNNLLYDRLRNLAPLAVDPRILVVAIDDRSLESLGRWPWPRSVHAELLDRLAAAGARSVLLDVIFSEPASNPDSDRQLARSLCRAGNVLLPLLRESVPRYGEPPREIPPTAPLAGCAAGIGHINVEADSDGTVRSVYLREGPLGQPRPLLAWQAFADAGAMPMPMPGLDDMRNLPGWQRDHAIRIPFIGADAGFPSVPYVSVLRGEVPDSLLRDRLVLVGATAPGLGDRYVTPLSASLGTTPGVEIQANILNGLLQQRTAVDLQPWLAALLSAAGVALLLGLMLFRSRHALLLTLACAALALGLSWALLLNGWWWSPLASLVGLLLAYLIWSWRRLNAVLAYFGWELARLDREPKVLPERASPPRAGNDPLQNRIAALEQAVSRTRDSRRFMADGLEGLPVATLICDPQGQILLANRKARDLFGGELRGDELRQCLAELGHPSLAGGARPTLETLEAIEFRDHRERDLRLDLARLLPVESETAIGWLVSLIDLSAERDAERQRATLLRFLSHDLRAPHSAILALLDVRPAEDEAGQQVYRQIEQQVRRALGLTDAFVQLAKAESDAYRFEACMFTMLAMDAADQLWPLAQQKDIDLRRDWDDEQEPMVWADPGLLTRALFNLLENAVKYSPAGTVVSLSIRLEGDWLSCRIVDQGKGIAAAELPRLFSQYQRFASAEGSAGLGLGLAMVKTVIDRHGGRIGCQSQVGQGTTFEIRLPLLKGEE